MNDEQVISSEASMTEERLQELLEKADSDTLSPEEELELLNELNKGVDELRRIINTLPDVAVSEDNQ